jgi:predicted DsbA family dithiol-disulfide isomerase
VVGDFDLDFEWVGFQLHPETPFGGLNFSDVFPGGEVEGVREYVRGFAQGFGVTMGFPNRVPNTLRALAVAEYARSLGHLDLFRDAAMEAHWNRGMDIEADHTLVSLAREADLDPRPALAAADDATWRGRVESMAVFARRWQVSGIPTWFLIPEDWRPGQGRTPSGAVPLRVVGCQSYEYVRAACIAAGIRRRLDQ